MLDLKKFAGLNSINCAGLGEVLFDVYPQEAKLGGAPANFAYHCRQLGLNAMVISAVGADDLGERARQELAAKYLPALMPTVPFTTGYVQVSLSADGVPSYEFAENTAYDNIPFTELCARVAATTHIACFGTLAQRGTVSHQSVLKFLDTMPADLRLRVFDINLRSSYYSAQVIEQCLTRCEAVKCNEDELPTLCRFAGLPERSEATAYYAYLQSHGVNCLIFTEGAKQSSVFLNDEYSYVPTPRVDAIDTVGAGDSFTASLVSLLVKGYALKKAHQLATQIAGFVCTQRGAMPEFSAQIRDLLKD